MIALDPHSYPPFVHWGDDRESAEGVKENRGGFAWAPLDESDWSELEYTEAWEWAERELGEFPNWQDAFDRATENTGYSDDEAAGAIEEARKELEELQPLWESHASCPIDPAQLKLWAGVSDRL